MKLANSSGRYVFARDALEDAPPCIDRVELVSEQIVLPGVTADHRFGLINALGGGELFEGYVSAKHLQSIRSNRLLGGNIKFFRGANNELRFTLKLDLNLTRFLQYHDCPVDTLIRQGLLDCPANALDIRNSSEGLERIRRARMETFDRSDNYITELSMSRYIVSHWNDRFEEYLSIVLSAIAEELLHAMQAIDVNPNFNLSVANGLLRQGAVWKLRQAEFYWEFAVQNASSKMQSIASDCVHVLREGYVTSYETPNPPREGRQRNSPYVRGILGRESVYGKIYVKAAGVIRFEVQYVKPPARLFSREFRVAGALSDVFVVLRLAEQDASNRACDFWREFWSLRSPSQIVDRSSFYRFIRLVYDACAETGIPPDELLALLVTYRNGEPFWTRRQQEHEPFRYLLAAGVLNQMSNSHNRRPRYHLVAEYRAVAERLNNIFEGETVGEGLLRNTSANFSDEDISPSRVRPRIIPYRALG